MKKLNKASDEEEKCLSECSHIFPYDENWEQMNGHSDYKDNVSTALLEESGNGFQNADSNLLILNASDYLNSNNNDDDNENSRSHSEVSGILKNTVEFQPKIINNKNETEGDKKHSIEQFMEGDALCSGSGSSVPCGDSLVQEVVHNQCLDVKTGIVTIGETFEEYGVSVDNNQNVYNMESKCNEIAYKNKTDDKDFFIRDEFCQDGNSNYVCDNKSIREEVKETQSNDVDVSTDFTRYKTSNMPPDLFPSNIWQSINNNDWDALCKHANTKLTEITQLPSTSSNSRKRTHCSNVDNGQEDGKQSESTENNDSFLPSKKKVKYSVTKQTKAPMKTYPKIPDDCYLALDCEMVGVGPKGSRSILGRCSIVDFNGTVVYDKFVRPTERITDYRTRWSGIRPRHMKTAEPPRKALRDIHTLLQNKIVIGHSVKNDFEVVQYFPHHYLVRDIAKCKLLSNLAHLGHCRQGNGLKNLTKKILGRDIQVGKKGHNSVEDAIATLELFKLVREDWEKQLFDSWRRKGFAVEYLVTCLKEKKKHCHDEKEGLILDFQQTGKAKRCRRAGKSKPVRHVMNGCLLSNTINCTSVSSCDKTSKHNDNNNNVSNSDICCIRSCSTNGANGSLHSDVNCDNCRKSVISNWAQNEYVHMNDEIRGKHGRVHIRQNVDFLSDEFWPCDV